jgi:large subunit ribosomal protein L23
MKLTDVLIKPVLTEKVNKQIEKNRSYTFIVDRKSNKLEIKKQLKASTVLQLPRLTLT